MTIDDTALPDILRLTPVEDHVYRVTQPEEAAEGRDVVFSGQLQGQMIMASAAAAGGTKDVRSVHTIFARAGTYTKPIDLDVDSMQAGRTWGSDTVTARQDGRLLARSLVLLNIVEPDLIRHGPPMPTDVPGPADLQPADIQRFPGAETRQVPVLEGDTSTRGLFWHRFASSPSSPAANQAIIAWATCGNIIGLAMRAHPDRVKISDSHRSLSTGVIAHTIHFIERIDVAEWLLVVTDGESAAGGRVYGSGTVFAPDGRLLAVFHQDSMAKAADGQLDPKRAM